MRKHNTTDEEFIEAWMGSPSIRQVLIKIGLAPQGGNYRTVTDRSLKLGLNRDHMTGRAHNKGKKYHVTTVQDYLVYGSRVQSYKLKNRLLSEGILDSMCSVCGITEWMGKPAPLELDHIDGDNRNNVLDNLRILCPNCHAQTDTYRGKNKGRDEGVMN